MVNVLMILLVLVAGLIVGWGLMFILERVKKKSESTEVESDKSDDEPDDDQDNVPEKSDSF